MSGGDDSHCDSLNVNREEEEDEEEDEEEEETFISLKSPETSGGCWNGCVPLWHQATILVLKHRWVCRSTKVLIFFQNKSTKSYLE